MSVESFVVGQKVKFRDDWYEHHMKIDPCDRLKKWRERPYMTVTKVRTRRYVQEVILNLEDYDGVWTKEAITAVPDAYDGDNFNEHDGLFEL